MINIGIIGCGYWGPNLIRNFHEILESTVTHCCDLNQERLAHLKKLYPHMEVTTDYTQLIKQPQIDALVIVTPPHTHYKLAREALMAGKDVLIEKPLTVNVPQALELIELAENKKRILMVGHVFEYNPAVIKMKECLTQGELGDLYYMYATRVNLGRVRQELNAMWSLAPHDISIMIYLLGEEPQAVSAIGKAYLQTGIEDTVFLTIFFSNNRIGHIHVSWLDPNKKRTLTAVGSEKMIIYDDVDNEAKLKIYDKGVSMQEPYETFGEFQFRLRSGDIFIPKIDLKEPLKIECAHFLNCIQHRQKPLTDGTNGLRVVKVLEGGQLSLDNAGKVVKLK